MLKNRFGKLTTRKTMLAILATVLLSAAAQGLTAQPPLPANEQEKKILNVLEDIYLYQSKGMMNVPPEDGRLLRLLTEATGAKHVVELGTSNGYSGIWFCLALRTTEGKLTTYEIDAQRAELARQNFKEAGVSGIVTLIEGDAHQEVTKLKEPIDILFLDADKEGYIDYLNKLLPLVRPGGLILAHNVEDAGQDFTKAITSDPNLETVFQGQRQGLSVTLKKRPLPKIFGTTLAEEPRKPDVVFVPTPQDVVEKMLELVDVKKDDLLYDLGCGDGRIVVTAAQKYGCKAVGYDIDPERVKESLVNVEKNKVGNLARIEQKDIFTLDLSDANVITLYLLPSLNLKLIPQLEKLKPGSRIVSHDFSMEGIEPDKVIELTSSVDQREHTIYFWTTPLKKAKLIKLLE